MKIATVIAVTMVFPAIASASTPGWAPCGGAGEKLWSWSWAGQNGDNVETQTGSKTGKQWITWMGDLSGNNRHYHNATGEKMPAYDSAGLETSGSWGAYVTSLIPFMRHSFADGTGVFSQVLYQDERLGATGPFYTAFSGTHIRNSGIREMFGSDADHHLRLDQGDSRVRMKLGTSFDGWISDKGSIPRGPMVLEIWRDSNNVIHVVHNGTEVGNGSVVAGAWDMSGFGWNGDGSSGWDDYALELIVCSGLPTLEQRNEAREYLRSKWGLYGDGVDMPVAPVPPKDIEIE